MTIKQIKESGLLELYVLGELNQSDIRIVEKALGDFPSLKQDISEIETTLQLFANAHAIDAPTQVLGNILNEISSSATDSNNIGSKPNGLNTEVEKVSMWTKFQPLASLLGLIGLCIALYMSSNKLEDQKAKHQEEIVKCEEEKKQQSIQLSILQSLNAQGNQVIFADATEKYPDTKLHFNHNPDAKKNYIQVENLPELADNQSYQLWSLKGDDAPIPLDVFEDDGGNFIEVSFISDTDAYAITIEPKGGQDSPTMENLVAVIKIA